MYINNKTKNSFTENSVLKTKLFSFLLYNQCYEVYLLFCKKKKIVKNLSYFAINSSLKKEKNINVK